MMFCDNIVFVSHTGPAAAADGGGEAVPEASRGHAGAGAACAQPRHAGLRQPRPEVGSKRRERREHKHFSSMLLYW